MSKKSVTKYNRRKGGGGKKTPPVRRECEARAKRRLESDDEKVDAFENGKVKGTIIELISFFWKNESTNYVSSCDNRRPWADFSAQMVHHRQTKTKNKIKIKIKKKKTIPFKSKDDVSSRWGKPRSHCQGFKIKDWNKNNKSSACHPFFLFNWFFFVTSTQPNCPEKSSIFSPLRFVTHSSIF